MTVTGDATSVAQNDTARLTFRVKTQARQATTALDRNAARMHRVVAAIKARGITAANIRTQDVGLSRVRIKIGKHRHRHVYRAVNGVRVTIRPVEKTGAVIDAAVHAGATSVGDIDLSFSKARELYRDALGDAFDDAKAKAQELADRADATLGPAQTIDEGFQEDNTFSAPQARAPAGGTAPTPIEPGTTSVFAEVTVTFALE